MIAFARFLLILFAIFFLVRIITRYALRRYFTNMQNNFQNQQNQYNQKKEGDVTINTKPKTGKKINKDEGDYVDFEELEDK
jgi:membrane protein implicated in regulation of membrane protease activity